MIELLIQPSKTKAHHYQAYLGDTVLCTSRTPFFEGARVLLSRGYDPNTGLTLRHRGAAHVSLRSTISAAAGQTVIENSREGPILGVYELYPLKERRKAEKHSAPRIKSEHQGGVTHGNEAVLGV